jgi:deoxycytidylate deaminase
MQIASRASAANDTTLANEITDRLSQELVIALVGPVGSGVSTAAAQIRDVLAGDFGYDVAPIFKPSDIISRQCPLVNMVAPGKDDLADYIQKMQDAGNKLRERFGNEYLVEKIIEQIKLFRESKGGYAASVEQPGRRAYIIDSLKNVEELTLLQNIYRESLCVVGVFAPDEIRRQRLIDGGAIPESVGQLMSRDQAELMTFGQNTRKLFVEADLFVCNDRRPEELNASIKRFLDIVFDTAIHTPTRAESAMYEADAASANSACMSRQVGASIVSARGELIAVGWNDVPKFGGGLYIEEDGSRYDKGLNAVVNKDHRCHNWKGGICHNETRRTKIISTVSDAAATVGNVSAEFAPAVRDKVAQSEIADLIEYSRSIHAEMEAILSVAREGKHSLVGATLYTNTYPCHNCARHIVAAGIINVVYIQPYVKSLATQLHADVVTEIPGKVDMVVFRQFDGIAPRNFIRLFKPTAPRKKEGRISRTDRANAIPIFRVPLDARSHYEDKVIADLAQKEQTV